MPNTFYHYFKGVSPPISTVTGTHLASQKSPSPMYTSQKYSTPPTNAGLKYSQTPPPLSSNNNSNNNNNNISDSKNPFLVPEPIVAPLATSETLATPGINYILLIVKYFLS